MVLGVGEGGVLGEDPGVVWYVCFELGLEYMEW